MMLAAVETVTKADPVWESRRHNSHVAAQATAGESAPVYSPEFMAMEGVWKTTRKMTTHNTFFVTPDQRDAKLIATFNVFQRRPALIAAHVARCQ
jgi:hypothetical protein